MGAGGLQSGVTTVLLFGLSFSEHGAHWNFSYLF